MTWVCLACAFGENEDTAEACIACGTPVSGTDSTDRKRSVANSNNATLSTAKVIVIEFPDKQKLGVKLMPPKKGIIDHGISVDNIDNPLLDNKVHPGDMIIAIGGKPVDGLGFSEAIELIRTLSRPLAISFETNEERRIQSRSRADTQDWETQITRYAVVFDEGPMGLNLEDPRRLGIEGALVKALKGQALESGLITIGDIVAEVNGVDVICLPYPQVMDAIKNAQHPRTIQFVPKEQLTEVQRAYSRQTEVVRPRDSIVGSKYSRSSRIIQNDVETQDDKSITQLILENRSATIKKGRVFKQGRLMRNWKSRYMVLCVSKLEYFKSPSSTSSRGELSFVNHRCTVRDLPSQVDLVCKSPAVPAKWLIELRVADRKLVMACTSDTDKKAWMEALKLAIDASKTVNRTNSTAELIAETKLTRGVSRTRSEWEGNGLNSTFSSDMSASRLSQFDYNAFPAPVLHITVLSASNLTRSGSSVNAFAEVTLGVENFRTSTVRSDRSPVWKQDNAASFEAPNENAVIEIRIFDEHVFRSSELLSTLTVPLKSLPNMHKTIKKYPLVLSSRSAGAQLTLSLEYVNKAKAYQQEQERMRLTDDLARSSMMMERDTMTKIQNEAQQAADEAAQLAKQAEEEAHALLNAARRKAEAAVAAAREEAAQGKAAVEAAMAEAALAKEEAEKQAREAKRAQEEALALIEANRRVQETAIARMADTEMTSQYLPYRRMLAENVAMEEVRTKMALDGIDEANIAAFIEGLISHENKVRELQEELDKLTKKNKKIQRNEDLEMLASGSISKDQEKLLRRLLKLERQLQQAGITIAEDIPYEEAKQKVEEISQRMQEIGSADVSHPDPRVQKQLREEYYKLEQDMEKYNTALMLTDEYAAEEKRKEEEWEQSNSAENQKALVAVRRCMPVDIKTMSEAQLESDLTPSRLVMSREIARKFKRTNVLELLRTNPNDISRIHPIVLENLRVTGLTLTERRALHVHLRPIAETWEAQKSEEMSGRKWAFFKSLRQTFKTLSMSYDRHVEQYGPPGNHPYATRDHPDVGCPLIGKQCPLRANCSPDYSEDYGYPPGDVYTASTVQKSDAEDAGAKALREAQELVRAKVANARAETLKKHYKGNIRLTAMANGACEDIDSTIDRIEVTQAGWFEARILTSGTDTKVEEYAQFNATLNEVRLSCLNYAERTGMKLSGKRNAANDEPDTRSLLEISLLEEMIVSTKDLIAGIVERMNELGAMDGRVKSSISSIQSLLDELHRVNETTSHNLGGKKPLFIRKRRSRYDIMKEVREKIEAEGGSVEDAPPMPTEPQGIPQLPGRMNVLDSIRGARGGGTAPGRGGRGGLLAAIQAKKKADADPGGRGGGAGNDMLAAIRGRGMARGRSGRGRGRGGLMGAVAARRNSGEADAVKPGNSGDLMSAIRARNKE